MHTTHRTNTLAVAFAAAACLLLALLGAAAAADTYPEVIIDKPFGASPDQYISMLKILGDATAGDGELALDGDRGCTAGGDLCLPGRSSLTLGSSNGKVTVKTVNSDITVAQHALTDPGAANVSLTASHDNVTGITTVTVGQPSLSGGHILGRTLDTLDNGLPWTADNNEGFKAVFEANQTVKGEITTTFEDSSVVFRSHNGVVRMAGQGRVRSDSVRVFSATYTSESLALPQATAGGQANMVLPSTFETFDITEDRGGFLKVDATGSFASTLLYVRTWATVRIVAEVTSLSNQRVTVGACAWSGKKTSNCQLYNEAYGAIKLHAPFEQNKHRITQGYAVLSADNGYTGTIQWQGRMKVYPNTYRQPELSAVRWGISADWGGATPGLVAMKAKVTVF